MDNPLQSKKRFRLPALEETVFVLRRMKIWQKITFLLLTVVFLASFLLTIWKVGNLYMVDAPAFSGSLAEGIIGTPRFINPILATSDADRDMTALIYSGLLRTNNQGELINDMAEKYSVSEDGLVYTFTLKPKLLWQDGEPITSDDIIFTIGKIKDPSMKSPKRAGWEGVDAEKIDDRSFKLTLKKPYAPFLENATVGILPGHIWSNLSSDQIASSEMNITPVGSGPYKIGNIKRNSAGIISSYELSANKNFALGRPNVKKMILRFYSSDKELLNAYQKREVESVNAITPQSLEKINNSGSDIKTLNLPRIFGAFFNQNNNKAFAKKEVRQALNMSADRKKIIAETLKGFGSELYNPLPVGTFGALENASDEDFSLEKAKSILEQNGWKMNDQEKVLEKKEKKEITKLAFTISTADTPELKQTAYLLKSMWEQLGAKVDVKIFEIGDLNQNIIRPRKYDALLFGEIVGRDPDPFAFWHSSQRNDPGLNVALYANIKVDKLLDEARTAIDETARKEKYKTFQEEVAKDIPAVFLYSPKFIYITPSDLRGTEEMKSVTMPSERFSTIYKWYRETNKVWKIFAK